MLSKRNVKMTAIALAGFVSLGMGGITVSAAEASSFHHGHNYEVQELAHKHHNSHPKKYSEGERNTAAIVGAVVGAIIAKNT